MTMTTTNTETTSLKKELDTTTERSERTFAGKTFTPPADIFETEKALMLVLDMPGVKKGDVSIRLENDLLEIEGRVAVNDFDGRQAVYSEYNVGNYYRRFNVSNKIARDGIEAKMADGVLTLSLPKIPDATPRRIPVH